MPPRTFRLLGLVVFAISVTPSLRADGPKVPEGFTSRLVASVPAVEFPCQVATAPGAVLFVAEDPMDQRGPYEAFDGRILKFQGEADPVEFATGFRAIQGMAWYNDSLYVCHMPFLTVIKDTNGDGKADQKKDLFIDLGPTNNQGLNDHIVSGLQFGMDGWLYISVGDKGVPGATRPEDGKKVQIKGGGVLRCRPDGTGLEVVTFGTRNHLEANLDEIDQIFTYDNTDDGDGWWTRVTHHIDGGYYGYPYDYHDRPDRFLNRMAEYGGGSPCGAVFYREDAWPEEYRGIGLWAEWGKGKVHGFRFVPKGATFEVGEAVDFALPDTLKDFRPFDLAISDDGRTLYIADWNMGGWGNKTERVGRVWAVSPSQNIVTSPRGKDTDPVDVQIFSLNHPSYNERIRAQRALIAKGKPVLPLVQQALSNPQVPVRAKTHLVWVLDGIAGGTPDASLPLISVLKTGDLTVRTQAARALGDRAVPIAVQPLIDQLSNPQSPKLVMQSLIALGRIGDPLAVQAIMNKLLDSDPYVAFSARVALRRIGDWNSVGKQLTASYSPEKASAVIGVLDGIYQPAAVDLLMSLAAPANGQSLDAAVGADQRALGIRALAAVARKALPWDGKWWGTRPSQGGPPRQTEAWEKTEPIEQVLAKLIESSDAPVRLAAIKVAQSNASTAQISALRNLISRSKDLEEVRLVIKALGAAGDKGAVAPLTALVKSGEAPKEFRLEAIRGLDSLAGDDAVPVFVDLLEKGGLGVDADIPLIQALGKRKVQSAAGVLKARLNDPAPQVRSAALVAMANIPEVAGLTELFMERLKDQDSSVRAAAIGGLGTLKAKEAVPTLITLAGEESTRFEATRALSAIADPRALRVYLKGLTDKNPELRKDVAAAVSSLRDQLAPVLEQLAERKELPPSVIPELRKIYNGMQPIRSWSVLGPFARDNHAKIDPERPVDLSSEVEGLGAAKVRWSKTEAIDERGQIDLNRLMAGDNRKAFGYAELVSPQARKAEMLMGSDDTLTVWLNGKKVFESTGNRAYIPGQDRLEIELVEGTNRFLVECGNSGGGWQYAVELSGQPDYSFLQGPASGSFDSDAFAKHAVENKGDLLKGQALFNDLKGLACIKCHKVGKEGGDVGPDLSGIGAKYPRPQMIESILYPSAQIFSGYEPVVIATTDGQLLTGILKKDDGETVVIQDAESRTITFKKSDIEERRVSDVSLMPTGLAEGLTKEDFADLIGYLETLKEAAPAPAGR